MPERFAPQTRELLADNLHYEQRIAERGAIAARGITGSGSLPLLTK